MKKMFFRSIFFIGAFFTSFCSWLFAVALISRMFLDRQLAENEMLMACVFAVVFAIVTIIAMRWKIM